MEGRKERRDYCGLMLHSDRATERPTATCICPCRKCRVKACTTLFAIITRTCGCFGLAHPDFMTLNVEPERERETPFPFIRSAAARRTTPELISSNDAIRRQSVSAFWGH